MRNMSCSCEKYKVFPQIIWVVSSRNKSCTHDPWQIQVVPTRNTCCSLEKHELFHEGKPARAQLCYPTQHSNISKHGQHPCKLNLMPGSIFHLLVKNFFHIQATSLQIWLKSKGSIFHHMVKTGIFSKCRRHPCRLNLRPGLCLSPPGKTRIFPDMADIPTDFAWSKGSTFPLPWNL